MTLFFRKKRSLILHWNRRIPDKRYAAKTH
jgi:hypothetical protein